jgi:hypothetical protein
VETRVDIVELGHQRESVFCREPVHYVFRPVRGDESVSFGAGKTSIFWVVSLDERCQIFFPRLRVKLEKGDVVLSSQEEMLIEVRGGRGHILLAEVPASNPQPILQVKRGRNVSKRKTAWGEVREVIHENEPFLLRELTLPLGMKTPIQSYLNSAHVMMMLDGKITLSLYEESGTSDELKMPIRGGSVLSLKPGSSFQFEVNRTAILYDVGFGAVEDPV